jgi:hypothetical protein
MTEAHLTHLAVTVRQLEEALLELESALRADQREGIMTVYEHDVPSALAPAIFTEIERLRDEIRSVKERYRLAAETISDGRRLVAKLLLLAINLEGANSRSMAGYGDLDEKERKPLDDHVSRMIDTVNKLRELIGPLNLVPDRPPRTASSS